VIGESRYQSGTNFGLFDVTSHTKCLICQDGDVAERLNAAVC
jgi:hypothetical protein